MNVCVWAGGNLWREDSQIDRWMDKSMEEWTEGYTHANQSNKLYIKNKTNALFSVKR